MKTNRIILLATALVAIAVLSAVVISAQESTQEPPSEATDVPSSFNDNRINGDIFLGGLAIYCVDESGLTAGNTFQNGGITIWGADGQKYIELTVDELRGDEEVMQPVAEATMDASATDEPDMIVTPDATMDASATEEPMDAVLLARAETTNGTIWLFRVGTDRFSLQGTDNTGKFFTYTWTGCALGVLDAGALPLFPVQGDPAMTAEATSEATAEATAAS